MEVPEYNPEMKALVIAVEALRLEELDDGWVDDMFHAEFLDSSDLPADYEAGLEAGEVTKALAAAIRALDCWITDRTWAPLSQAVSYRPLLALLFNLVDYGNRNVYTKEYRTNAMLAAQLYCKLLAVPGFKAYSVYHTQLFIMCLTCLGFSKSLCESEECRLPPRERAREVNAYNTKLRSFLKDLKVVVALLELKPEEVAFEELVTHLMDLTGTMHNDRLNLDKLELTIISQLSYEIIHKLLIGTEEEPRPSCIQVLFKCLLPKLVATSMDCRASSAMARAAHVTYCGLLLAKYGKAALPGYNVLLQHLCFTLEGMERAEVRVSRVSLVVGLMTLLTPRSGFRKSMERAEVRVSRVSLVVGLMTLLPPRSGFRKFMNWVLQLCTTAKAPHRIMALEIMSRLLDNQPEEEKQDEELPPPGALTPRPDSPVPGCSHDEGEGSVRAGTLPGAASEDSQSSQESAGAPAAGAGGTEATAAACEEDAAPVITHQVHTVPHLKLLQAVYERAGDVSSTVRVRALAILTACVTSVQPAIARAVKKLNGDGEQPLLVSLAVRCLGDERAAVRKAAVTLVDVTLRRDRALLTNNNLGVLVSLCRDTSVMVRSSAVTTLGELMLCWPHACAFDAFLAGPMRQLKDPEPKVQEQIVQTVKTVLFDKLEPRGAGEMSAGERSELPWLFLGAVARHNMRRHLEKVCGMLAKTAKCINHRLVDTISTHVGADVDHELSCMVLLSGVARHVDYSDVNFLLDYYYDLTQDLQTRDARLLPLVLEVLTDWSRHLSVEQRTTLRAHLVQGLRDGSCGSEGSRRSCATLAAHLDPDDVGWASELLLACERRALAGAPVSEWVCAADMTLVAPEQPSSHLVQLFVSTAADFHEPDHELPESSRGCVVAGLGRMCVRSRAVASAVAPALSSLLVAPRAAICVRVNALLALADMCKRYTGIVEPLLGDICSCLEESPAPLRQAAVRSITRLLLDDFLRLRAPLYYRYCALLADADPEVREPAEYYVMSCLPSDVIYHHFVECLMYYNGCSPHSGLHSAAEHTAAGPSQGDAAASEPDGDSPQLHLPRPSTFESMKFDSRQLIYDLMLQRLTPGQRLTVQCRLATEVLRHAAELSDEEAPLARSLQAAVVDTVAVLRGSHMRPPRKPQTAEAANVEDLTARVTSNIVSQKMKRTVAEVLVPAVIRLYSRIGSSGVYGGIVEPVASGDGGGDAGVGGGGGGGGDTPELASCLVGLASDLLRDYKQEIEELIDNDPELVEQITRFQKNIGEEPSFRSQRNIVLRDEPPDTRATPYMRAATRSRRTPLSATRNRQPPTKRALRL